MHHYLRHLANFARVVEAGSMKAASDLIGVAPSGLSDSVRILEARIGAPLLVRHAGGVTPTSEGERVYVAAEGIVDLLDDALGEVGDRQRQPCRLSVPSEIANTCIAPVLSHLRETQPHLQVSLFIEDDVVDHARFGRDYFLRFASKPRTYDGMRTLWAGEVRAIMVASAALTSEAAAHDPDAVSQLPYIGDASGKPEIVQRLGSPKGEVCFDRSLIASQAATRLTLAQKGFGVTPCLDVCAAPGIAAGHIRHVLADRFSIPITVQILSPHRRKQRMDDAVVEAFGCVFSSDYRSGVG